MTITNNSKTIEVNLPEVEAIEAMIQNKPKGFAAMSKERRTELARKGGLAMPSEARAYSKNRNLAREAGRKGGLARKKSNVHS